jgi:hypothetical protein
MYPVTEKCGASKKLDLRQRIVTPVAVTGGGKSLPTVVTSATGPPEFHFFHQVSFTIGTGNKQSTVTATALVIKTEMIFVAEKRISFKTYILDGMAFSTAPLDSEG